MLDHKRQLGRLIDAALTTGQRGDGQTPERHWAQWTNIAFAKAVSATESAVRGWRDPDAPSRPLYIIPILTVFYGEIPRYAEPRKAMLLAWRLAGGIDAEDPPDPRAIQTASFSDVAEVVHLLVNQPTPDNAGNLLVPYTLRFFHDKDRKIPIVVNGKRADVRIDIGLKDPMFAVESVPWQPAQDTIFRQGEHPNATPASLPDSVRLTGPTDRDGHIIVGEPLRDVSHIVMEKKGPSGDGVIVLSVLAARTGFRVVPSGGDDVSATAKAVLDAIFASAIPRDRSDRSDRSDRLIVASTAITPGSAIPDRTAGVATVAAGRSTPWA